MDTPLEQAPAHSGGRTWQVLQQAQHHQGEIGRLGDIETKGFMDARHANTQQLRANERVQPRGDSRAIQHRLALGGGGHAQHGIGGPPMQSGIAPT
ncbi:hypothetical protein D3C80_1498410 [compost metagenome]